MGLRINTNIDAMSSHRHLVGTASNLARSMERLSSGLRINSAKDDPAGLGISERMRTQIKGVQQARRNAQDGISLVQTAEGSLQEVTSILQRVRELAVQYNNGIYGTQERSAMVQEVAQMSAELNRIISSAEFAGVTLLTGPAPGILATLQVGPNPGDIITVNGVDLAASLGAAVISFATATFGTVINISAIDSALDNVGAIRGGFGAVQNRLDTTVNSLATYEESLSSSESRIRDVDLAEEMTRFTALQILQESGTAMLAQANQSSATVLALLQ